MVEASMRAEALAPAAASLGVRPEFTRATRGDFGYSNEITDIIAVHTQTATESVNNAGSNVKVETEFSPSTRSNGSIAAEWAGGLSIARDMSPAVEWSMGARGEATTAIEIVGALIVAHSGAMEWISTIRSDDELSDETIKKLLFTAGVPAESLSSGTAIIVDSTLWLEAVGTPPATILSVEIGPGRVRLLATSGRIRLLRRNS
jgi:hypothetical protein